jgi:hypothetical protein
VSLGPLAWLTNAWAAPVKGTIREHIFSFLCEKWICLYPVTAVDVDTVFNPVNYSCKGNSVSRMFTKTLFTYSQLAQY